MKRKYIGYPSFFSPPSFVPMPLSRDAQKFYIRGKHIITYVCTFWSFSKNIDSDIPTPAQEQHGASSRQDLAQKGHI